MSLHAMIDYYIDTQQQWESYIEAIPMNCSCHVFASQSVMSLITGGEFQYTGRLWITKNADYETYDIFASVGGDPGTYEIYQIRMTKQNNTYIYSTVLPIQSRINDLIKWGCRVVYEYDNTLALDASLNINVYDYASWQRGYYLLMVGDGAYFVYKWANSLTLRSIFTPAYTTVTNNTTTITIKRNSNSTDNYMKAVLIEFWQNGRRD